MVVTDPERTEAIIRFRNDEIIDAIAIHIRYEGYPSFRGHRYTVLDDLNKVTLARLVSDGFNPCAVVEASGGNLQAWIKHPAVLPKLIGTFAVQTLAGRYDAALSAADWRRCGRLPGFTNLQTQVSQARWLGPIRPTQK